MHSENEFEAWRISGVCENYEVSNLGRVRSKITGKYFQLTPRINGYVSVLFQMRVGVQKRFYVHRLVAQAFHGQSLEGMDVNHIDFNRSNNTAKNLEVVTRLENAAHSKRAGRLALLGSNTPKGDDCKHSKLHSAQVRRIRALKAEGHSLADLAGRFSVSKNQIKNIVDFISWRHLV